MTPPQVDDLFAAVDEVMYKLDIKILKGWDHLHVAVGDKRDRYGSGLWDMTMLLAEKTARKLAEADPKSDAARAIVQLEEIQAEQKRIRMGVLTKLNGEFDRRGGWSRAFLAVTNGNGHVHDTENCSSCHRGAQRTRLHWMTEWSGKTKKKIVEDAGERACTLCYPDAPTSDRNRPTKMFSPDEIEAARAREERAVAKVEREKKKAEKAITDADGGPLKVYTWTQKAHQKMVRGALVDVPAREFFETLATTHAARGWLTDEFDRGHENDGPHRDVGKVADAIALKEGKTRDQVIEEAKVRAKKRK